MTYSRISSQESTPLLDALRGCVRSPNAPFYAPGHKRGQGISDRLRELFGSQVFQADLPELPELDNLFAPEGVILQAQQLAADAFGADRTWFLANGSTSGVVAAILATCGPGDKIVLPRNVHQSAVSGLILSGAIPIFLAPEYDPKFDIAHSITPASISEALASHPDAKAVMMVYPTYYGVCGGIEVIAHIAHQHNIPLLVDEAHGPHFGFHPDLPMSALAAGADLTVQSTHKVLSALTQAAMLHTQGMRVDTDRLSKSLQLVQSTSPSYLLLASLDAARHQMATQGKELIEGTLALANRARSRINQIPGLFTLTPNHAGSPGFLSLDETRLTVAVSNLGIDGFQADELLHQQFGVTAELPSLQHLTFIVSLGNTDSDINQLIQAFEQLANEMNQKSGVKGQGAAEGNLIIRCQSSITNYPTQNFSPPPLSPRDAFFSSFEMLPIEQSIDRISAELVCPYPPGIPVLLPGEAISFEALDYLHQVLASGGIVSGCTNPTLKTLKVVR